MEKFDVVVVGAGPSGASTAFFLARQGIHVALLDKSTFPRDKICGDGIGPRAAEMLDKMGLYAWLTSGKYHRCDSARLFASDGSYFEAQIPVEDCRYPHFHMVPRLEFDHTLLTTAEVAGATVYTNRKATGMLTSDGAITGIKAIYNGDEVEIACRAVICADGTHGTFAKCTGIECVKPHAFAVRAYYTGIKGPDDCINVFVDEHIPEGYAWIFPTGNSGANIGLGLSTLVLKERSIDTKALMNWFMAEKDTSPIDLSGATAQTEIKGAHLRMGYGRHDVVADGVMLVGDAAALISPLSGEGIAYALESGEQAAYAMKRALDKGDVSAASLKVYQDFLAKNFFSEHRQGEFIRQLFARSNYKSMDWMLKRGIQHPELAGKFVSVMMSTTRPSALLTPKVLRYYMF
ncbi:MAG TPA: geranylgeranyl reductase family protein [Candidatus Aquicultor sp.]|jgi:geranylgeranyl reductase family protein